MQQTAPPSTETSASATIMYGKWGNFSTFAVLPLLVAVVNFYQSHKIEYNHYLNQARSERKLDVQRRMKLIDRLLDKCFQRHGALVLIVAGLLCLQITTSDSTPLDDSNSNSGSISSSANHTLPI
uniref:Uncharacterized protein n=1 Tax=Anopheles culicifacies TaxID=139723 RepID=A0A182LXP0_9DIPT